MMQKNMKDFFKEVVKKNQGGMKPLIKITTWNVNSLRTKLGKEDLKQLIES